MRSQFAIGVGLFFAVASPFPALAQSAGGRYPAACAATSVPPAKSEEAHAFYSAGRALYDEGNYDAAIVQFREAYKRDCSKHDLLIIISRAYELKGDKLEAVRALEAFLERVKDSSDAATHRTKIENLKKQIAAQPPPPVVAPPTEVREHTTPPWIMVGVGGVGAVVGVVVLVVAPKLPPGCVQGKEDTCFVVDPDGTQRPPKTEAERVDVDEKNGRAETSVNTRRVGLVMVIAGVAVVGGGLLWHFLEPTGPVASTGFFKPKVTPEVAPGYAGMSVGGTF